MLVCMPSVEDLAAEVVDEIKAKLAERPSREPEVRLRGDLAEVAGLNAADASVFRDEVARGCAGLGIDEVALRWDIGRGPDGTDLTIP